MHHRTLSLLFSLLLLACFNAHAIDGVNSATSSAFSTPEFLKVDEAFIFNSKMTDKGLELSWKIADDYYLYQERFKFKTQQVGVILGEPQFSIKGKAFKKAIQTRYRKVCHYSLDGSQSPS